MNELVIGIDLGTTNSEVAAFFGDRVQVLGPADSRLLPSCVGLAPDGELLIGKAARNQQLLYPERTVRSIKRKMGSDASVKLGDLLFTPPEISAFILRALAEQASRVLGETVKKAVITVPAYFSDAQRQATREAGVLADLDVIRILNEPTAASLAYGYRSALARTVLVYDLGGGTFDVSIVQIEGDVTEVLASHGNNQLGGDDFNELLVKRLVEEFRTEHGVDLESHGAAHARLFWAVEEAKKTLSFEPYAKLREESLVSRKGKTLHLEREIPREEYEELIRPLVESTLESVSKALGDAGKGPSDIDAVLLVGGSTRTPLVASTLEECLGIQPSQEVHPDLCVALGAGTLASRLAGREVERVLVDVSPYSFGPSYMGLREGASYAHCYHPIIRRNTPLPVTRTEKYYTPYPNVESVKVEIYQGEDSDALKNLLVGEFTVEGLTPMEEENEVLCRMSLDLDGILEVTAIEKCTGKSKQITIDQALQPRSEEEIRQAQKAHQTLYSTVQAHADDLFVDAEEAFQVDEASTDSPSRQDGPEDDGSTGWTELTREAHRLVARSRELLPHMHDEDKEEAVDLNETIEKAVAELDEPALSKAVDALKELVFFVEGK
ncbi:MAG: heat-shock protein Hsp70 [Acidobacteria bacterium]|nr:MAG: heat-shock protein Hsp70 [Acidobacteriota bacterium]